MFKRNVLAVSMTLAALCSAQAAMADINGGGATLPQKLYLTPEVLPAGFAPYIGVGSGKGKIAFLENKYIQFGTDTTKNVHWAGSDSKLTSTELATYATDKEPGWGKLIQVPSVGTAVAIPFNKSGTAAVDLSVNELCGVFSGRIADWSGITGSGRTGAIKLVYRSESSGTTELFTRFLNAKCTAETGTFNVTTTFGTSYTGGLPTGAVSATGSQGVMTTLSGTDGGITYMSPDFAAPTLAGLDDATKVARVGKNVATNTLGVSPAAANVSAAISAVPLPATTARGNPDAWVPVFGATTGGGVVAYPSSGYPILGFTNLIFSQCYADATQTSQVREFFTKHYGASANNDAAIEANAFVPLPSNWKLAIRGSFLTASNALSIGNTNVCNGKGRPL
ncbi:MULTISPECIES: substrate-binding domain-containing protein [Pseudomonas]|jgi:ABC-type phosphate transport system substrate-binding protein|uniref:Phosphate-binding protein PstS n=1 Tax=Pseudomonas grimontii TaxID=129847 RepID=A0A1H1HVI4_9PSED|nr:MULTISPECIES: substrate-binding domain-containing protein [Pseudomonas]MCS3515625.1 ABC-type phosphate transport system substrate-binding protein [Pseudomonas grimontii]MCS4315421.1 ABC-type phosphate transport system substrate-binding protein [Pseudomonas sp. BIGb0381]NJJ60967.1 PstS family phosphate ABC transporter substrate-binding protein [Pseudomonas sp. B14(2022)]TWR66085.1 PstS family phosphate ABC transporter substrate-binding protein [Pseudomonas grimontii]SDR29076.1 ABC-type phosp